MSLLLLLGLVLGGQGAGAFVVQLNSWCQLDPDGFVRAPSGSTLAPGGSMLAPDGSTLAPGGSTLALGGSMLAPGGSTLAPDGFMLAPDGFTLAPDGSALAPDGSALAPNGSVTAFGFTVAFNRNVLVRYEGGRFVACDAGALSPVADRLAALLNNGTTWRRRAEERRGACRDVARALWAQTALRRTPPRAAIIPVDTGNARAPVRLTCHVWGFYPRDVTVIWLRNGDVLGPGDHPAIEATANGDWTYQTRVTLTVSPEAGDVFTCSVQHVSLEEPLLEDWRPGLSLAETLQVAAATVLLVLGVGVFVVGLVRCRARPPAPGYTPLPGDNYPAGST
ncbi:class II histocompatibility antigen, M beta 1 chain [Eudromia elegans]